MNKLAPNSKSSILTFSSFTKSLLTEDEIAVAVNKGWVVT